MKIIKNINLLKEQADITNIKEGNKIARKLIEKLKAYKGIGLSAPQLGIYKKVFVTWLDKVAETFINPKIISRSNSVFFSQEKCLSLPGITKKIERWRWVTLICDNWLEPKTFGDESLFILPNPEDKIKKRLIETSVVQHEIDHLIGCLIIDKENYEYKI